MYELNNSNQVTVAGEINSGFTFNHEVFGEKFYMFELASQRLSGGYDYIPVMVSERDIDVKKDYIGQQIMVKGQFRSFNKHEEDSGKSKVILSVFVKELEFIEEPITGENANIIFLDGFICKNPIYRKTPKGREIADFVLAVNRPYRKSDYIPCIAWGRNARFADRFKVGQRVQIHGRIQSRKYEKKLSEEESVTKTAYEVSVSDMRVIKDEE